jgi:hypothetical protein
MLITDETSAMHKQAAVDHHEAAKKHLLAAEFIEKNNMVNAKEMSQNALSSCAVAQKSSTWACKSAII